MKFIITLILLLFIINCSFNKDSEYWTEEVVKNSDDQNKISEVLKKSVDITNMTNEEYEIYIDDYTKKSKYPDLNQ